MSAHGKSADVNGNVAHIRECMGVAGIAIAVEWAYRHGDEADLERAMLLLTASIERAEQTRLTKRSLRAAFNASRKSRRSAP